VQSTERPATSLTLERFAVRPVLLIAAALFVLEMALARRYGFHGDELYFLDSARHLQGGYVDQPILIPLLARVSLSLFGVWLPGLRIWSALAVAATVIISALLARELGGRRNAQLLAAVATATMPALLGVGDILETTTLDIMFWSALALVVVRVGRTGDCRYWLLGGLVLGVGLANKHSIGFLPWRFSSERCSAGDRGWSSTAGPPLALPLPSCSPSPTFGGKPPMAGRRLL
jgi:hypothetical protein